MKLQIKEYKKSKEKNPIKDTHCTEIPHADSPLVTWPVSLGQRLRVELQTINWQSCTITEKAPTLVQAFSVFVKTDCETDGLSAALVDRHHVARCWVTSLGKCPGQAL